MTGWKRSIKNSRFGDSQLFLSLDRDRQFQIKLRQAEHTRTYLKPS